MLTRPGEWVGREGFLGEECLQTVQGGMGRACRQGEAPGVEGGAHWGTRGVGGEAAPKAGEAVWGPRSHPSRLG